MKTSRALLLLPLTALLLAACSSTPAPMASEDTLPVSPVTTPVASVPETSSTLTPDTTTLPPTSTVAPTTVAPVVTTVPVPTTKPKAPTTTTKPTTVTTVAGGVDEARAGARAMLVKVHESYYDDGNIITRGEGFKQIEARYAAYTTDAGSTPTGYYLTMNGVKTCYAASIDGVGSFSDTTC